MCSAASLFSARCLSPDQFSYRHCFALHAFYSVHPLVCLSSCSQQSTILSDSVLLAKLQASRRDPLPTAQFSVHAAPHRLRFEASSSDPVQGELDGAAITNITGLNEVTSTVATPAVSTEDYRRLSLSPRPGFLASSKISKGTTEETTTADATINLATKDVDELVARFTKQVVVDNPPSPGRSSNRKDTNTKDCSNRLEAAAAFQGEEEVDGSASNALSSSFTSALPGATSLGERGQRLPINLDLNLYRAKCLFREGEIRQAEAIFRQCIKDWPDDGRAYVGLGTRLMKQGKFVGARAVFEDGCQAVRGENPFIWQSWAILEEKSGNISQARKLFDAATAADLRHAAAWHGWAVLELRQGNVRKARELLSKGLKYCSANEYLFQTSALIEYKAGKVAEARALFDQALTCNPKSCASWMAWATLEADQGNNSTARHLFQKGILASPKNRYVWQAWALFEAKLENKKLARRLFKQGYEMNPQDAVLLQAYALFEYESSHPKVARELFELAASADPKHQPVWIAWGWVEWKEGNLDTARKYYKRSLSIDSGSMDAARTFHAWGILEEQAGNYSIARNLFRSTLKVDSQNAPAWLSWAKLEENVGNVIRAEEIRNQYLQQRTEIVEEPSWDMNLTSVLAPAIDRIKEFLKIDVPSKNKASETEGPVNIVEVLNNQQKLGVDTPLNEQEFDIDAFLREAIPWKYKSQFKSLVYKVESSNTISSAT